MYLHCFTLSHDCNTHYLMGPRGAAQGDGFDSPTSPRRHSAYSASFRDDATIVGIHVLHIMSLCGVYKYEYIHMYRVCIIYSYAHIYIYTYTHYDAKYAYDYVSIICIYIIYIILSDINHQKMITFPLPKHICRPETRAWCSGKWDLPLPPPREMPNPSMTNRWMHGQWASGKKTD